MTSCTHHPITQHWVQSAAASENKCSSNSTELSALPSLLKAFTSSRAMSKPYTKGKVHSV